MARTKLTRFSCDRCGATSERAADDEGLSVELRELTSHQDVKDIGAGDVCSVQCLRETLLDQVGGMVAQIEKLGREGKVGAPFRFELAVFGQRPEAPFPRKPIGR
jgi:hypothetical protein